MGHANLCAEYNPMQLRIILLALLIGIPVSSACQADPIDPAQAIAQKFYEADQPPQPPPVAKRIERKTIVKSVSPPGHDYEIDMLRRARAEEDERQKKDRQKPLLAVAQPAPALIIQPVATTLPKASIPPEPNVTEPAVLPEPPIDGSPQMAIIEIKEPKPIPQPQARATVLIVLDNDGPGQAHVKPDPIICFDQECWISNGLMDPAKQMPRSEALALKTTETMTGDSCSGKSGCAFRDIAFNPATRIEVIEVGESRGVSGGAYTVAADTSCQKREGTLSCDNGLATYDYRMWVVPEATAQAIGPSALEDAVADGLQQRSDNVEDGK